MNEIPTPPPVPSAPQTPRTNAVERLVTNFSEAGEILAVPSEIARTLELESAARQRVIDAIERECQEDIDLPIIQDILAIIADGKDEGV